MFRTTLKGLLDRKLRTVMSALAIVLGVAMVSGTYVLTDTLDKAFGGIFEGSYDETAVVISGKEIVEGSASGSPTVQKSLIRTSKTSGGWSRPAVRSSTCRRPRTPQT